MKAEASPSLAQPCFREGGLEAALPAQVAAHDDVTLEQHSQLWAASQPNYAAQSYCSARVDAEKKSLGATERNETDRAAWGDLTRYLPGGQLLFVDEWAATSL